MKRGMFWTVVWSSVLAFGCRSTYEDDYVYMQKRAAQIRENGGIAAAATGVSAAQDLACDKAQVRGRAELARIIELRVLSLQKDFREEVGDEAKKPEYNTLFSDATKVLVATELRGSVLQEVKYRAQGDTMRATVLMVINPKIIENFFGKESKEYVRFRASQAFKELDEEVKKYEEFKRRDRAEMPK